MEFLAPVHHKILVSAEPSSELAASPEPGRVSPEDPLSSAPRLSPGRVSPERPLSSAPHVSPPGRILIPGTGRLPLRGRRPPRACSFHVMPL